MSDYRTKTEFVYEALRRAILGGKYPPGSRVVADQIAQEMRVSRVPVREAIVRLVGEGWLASSPHVGALVPHLRPNEILETAIIRAAVEGCATRYAVEFMSEADLADVRDLLSDLEEAAKQDPSVYPELNLQFHARIFAPCPLPSLKQLASSLAEKALRWRTVRFLPDYLPDSQAEHRAIYQALQCRDAVLAEQLTEQHIETAGRRLSQFALQAV